MRLLWLFYFMGRVYRKFINIIIFKLNKVSFTNDFQINGFIFVKNTGSIEIGKNFGANSGAKYNPIGGDTILRLITQTEKAKITIGNNVGISNATIYCWDDITIEDNVVIGGSVRIWDSNFHSLNPIVRMSGNDNDIRSKPIKICKYVFIGGGSIILKGVTIGENSIIAAGSVVNESIPANVIAGGNPCRIIKKINILNNYEK